MPSSHHYNRHRCEKGTSRPPAGVLASAVSPGPNPAASVKTRVLPPCRRHGRFSAHGIPPPMTRPSQPPPTRRAASFDEKVSLRKYLAGDLLLLSTEDMEDVGLEAPGVTSSPHPLPLSFCRAIMSGLTTSKVFTPPLLGSPRGAFLAEMSKLPRRHGGRSWSTLSRACPLLNAPSPIASLLSWPLLRELEPLALSPRRPGYRAVGYFHFGGTV